MTDYLALLTHSYAKELESGIRAEPFSRLVYLGDSIFQFTTYDDNLTEQMAGVTVDVIDAINEKKTFEFIEDTSRYEAFIVMINMPFFAGRLSWGTSIRGAWWEHDGTTFESCGLWVGDTQTYQPTKYAAEEWLAFVRAVVVFARGA